MESLQLGNATRVTNKTFRLDRNKIVQLLRPSLLQTTKGISVCCKVLALAQLNQLTRFVFSAKDRDEVWVESQPVKLLLV